MFGRACGITLAFMAALLMTAPALTLGFASPSNYTGNTGNTGNDVCTDYFTAGIYSNEACTETPSTILADGLGFISSDSDVRTLSTPTVSAPSLYFKIKDDNHTWSSANEYYEVTATFSCSFNNTPVNSAVLSLYFGEDITLVANSDEAEGTVNLTADAPYTLAMRIENASVYMASEPTELNVSISINVTDLNTGTSLSNDTGTLSLNYVAPIVDTNTADEAIAIVNTDTPDIADENYSFENSVPEQTPDNETTVYAIEIIAHDQTGIADEHGNVSISILIPAGERFCIRISGDHATQTTNLFILNLTVDGITKTVGVGDKGATNGKAWSNTIFCQSKNTFNPMQCYSTSYNAESYYIFRANDSDYWMTGEEVSMTLTNRNGSVIPSDVRLEIIFWPHGV